MKTAPRSAVFGVLTYFCQLLALVVLGIFAGFAVYCVAHFLTAERVATQMGLMVGFFVACAGLLIEE